MAGGLVGGCVGLRPLSAEFHPVSSRVLLLLLPPPPPRRWASAEPVEERSVRLRRRKRNCSCGRRMSRGRQGVTVKALLPADPWAPGAPGSGLDAQSIASALFAASLFPYLGFLYHLTKSKTAPPLTLFGFYFLLAFVGATIPAGIYAKLHYGTSLSNVDWLHGSAESLLTLTNLFIVFGLRGALRNATEDNSKAEVEQEEKLPLSK